MRFDRDKLRCVCVCMCVYVCATTAEVAALSFQGKYGHNYTKNAISAWRQGCYNIVALKRNVYTTCILRDTDKCLDKNYEHMYTRGKTLLHQ